MHGVQNMQPKNCSIQLRVSQIVDISDNHLTNNMRMHRNSIPSYNHYLLDRWTPFKNWFSDKYYSIIHIPSVYGSNRIVSSFVVRFPMTNFLWVKSKYYTNIIIYLVFWVLAFLFSLQKQSNCLTLFLYMLINA